MLLFVHNGNAMQLGEMSQLCLGLNKSPLHKAMDYLGPCPMGPFMLFMCLFPLPISTPNLRCNPLLRHINSLDSCCKNLERLGSGCLAFILQESVFNKYILINLAVPQDNACEVTRLNSTHGHMHHQVGYHHTHRRPQVSHVCMLTGHNPRAS